MKILILEDEDGKFAQISDHVTSVVPDALIQREKTGLTTLEQWPTSSLT